MPFEATKDLVWRAGFAGVRAWTVGQEPIPTGVYIVQFTDSEIAPVKSGNNAGKANNVVLSHVILEECELKGRDFRTWTGQPTSPDEEWNEKMRRKWKSILRSIGIAEDQMNALDQFGPNMVICDQNGQGRVCYVHVTAADPNDRQGTDSNIGYISKEEYDKYKTGEWKPDETPRKRKGAGLQAPSMGAGFPTMAPGAMMGMPQGMPQGMTAPQGVAPSPMTVAPVAMGVAPTTGDNAQSAAPVAAPTGLTNLLTPG